MRDCFMFTCTDVVSVFQMSSRQSKLQSDVDTAVQFLSEKVPFVSGLHESDI